MSFKQTAFPVKKYLCTRSRARSRRNNNNNNNTIYKALNKSIRHNGSKLTDRVTDTDRDTR